MNWFFSSCLAEQSQQQDKLDTILPQPLKFRLLNGLNLMDFIIKQFAQPRKKARYLFPRNHLSVLTTQRCHIPILYFPAPFPSLALIMIYCHGSGSTLNNIYDFSMTIAIQHSIAVLAYDYTGDGESQKEFGSYEEDVKLVVAWVVRQGYKMNRIILCGFSLGSYSALCLQGQMARILISPICGIMSFCQSEAARYQGQKYDNVSKALTLRCRTLITHCSKQMVDISHGKLLHTALTRGNGPAKSTFFEITNQMFQHRSAPSFLCSPEGQIQLDKFLYEVHQEGRTLEYDHATLELRFELNALRFRVQGEATSEKQWEMYTTNV